METEYSLRDCSKGEEDEIQPDVVEEGIARLFDYWQLASTWPLSPNNEGHQRCFGRLA